MFAVSQESLYIFRLHGRHLKGLPLHGSAKAEGVHPYITEAINLMFAVPYPVNIFLHHSVLCRAFPLYISPSAFHFFLLNASDTHSPDLNNVLLSHPPNGVCF